MKISPLASCLALLSAGACATTGGNAKHEKEGAALSSPAPHVATGGGEVVDVPVDGTYAVAFRLLFYTGSIDDPKGKEGLTRLTAQLMAEGGTKRLSYPELLAALYPMAAEIDVQVDKEQTVFSGVVHRDHAEAFAKLIAEVLTSPRLPEADFARIRNDLVDDIEKRLRATDDENLGKEVLNLMMYGDGHPYGHFDGGTVEGLKAITLDDVRAHAARAFGKQRLVIGLGGDPKAEAAKKALTAALASLPEGEPRTAALPPVEKPSAMNVWIVEKPGKAVAISMGYPHQGFRGHPDASALGLVQSYFGEHRQFHGVLMNEMRGKRGLNYGDYAYVESFVQEGWSRNARTNIARRQQHFEIWIRPVDPKDAVFSIRLALFFLERLVTDGVTQEDVDNVRTFLSGYTRLWELTPERKLGHALDDHFYGTKNRLETFRKDLEDLTAEEVNAAIRRHLVTGPIHIAIVAPDAKALKAALLSGAPTAKTYEAKVTPDVLAVDEKVAPFPLGLTEANVRVVGAEELFVR